VLPALLLIGALLLLPSIRMGIDLAGGTRITVMDTAAVDARAVEQELSQFGLDDLSVKLIQNPLTGKNGVIVEYTGNKELLRAEKIAATSPEEAMALASSFITSKDAVGTNASAADYVTIAKADFRTKVQSNLIGYLSASEEQVSSTEIGAALGKEFWESSQRALIIALVLVLAVVFIVFRELVPSLAIAQAAIFDIIFAAGGMGLFGIPLTLPTVAALLLILGYAVDTNILLTDRVLKRSEGSVRERAWGAFGTALGMIGTTVVAVTVLTTFSYFNQTTTLFQIGSVLLCGLIADMVNTWFTNAVMVIWWAERKK